MLKDTKRKTYLKSSPVEKARFVWMGLRGSTPSLHRQLTYILIGITILNESKCVLIDNEDSNLLYDLGLLCNL